MNKYIFRNHRVGLATLIISLFLILFVGCNPSSPGLVEDASKPVTSETHIRVPDTPTFAQMELPSQTLEPTQTEVKTVAPTKIPQPTYTPTLQATMSPEKSQELVLKLMETNGGCELPCWWGKIFPGKTTWEDAKTFLQPFSKEIISTDTNSDVQQYWISFVVPDSVRKDEILSVPIDVNEGKVDKIYISQPYPISDLLLDFGSPSEIWIHAVGVDTLSPKGRFSLSLYWGDKGIMAVYDGEMEKNNPLRICLNDLVRPDPSLWLWDTTYERPYDEIGGELLLFSPPFQIEFHPLEEVSEIDIQTFHEKYKNPDKIDQCFEMPDPDWP